MKVASVRIVLCKVRKNIVNNEIPATFYFERLLNEVVVLNPLKKIFIIMWRFEKLFLTLHYRHVIIIWYAQVVKCNSNRCNIGSCYCRCDFPVAFTVFSDFDRMVLLASFQKPWQAHTLYSVFWALFSLSIWLYQV